jgi:hypothetical protein
MQAVFSWMRQLHASFLACLVFVCFCMPNLGVSSQGYPVTITHHCLLLCWVITDGRLGHRLPGSFARKRQDSVQHCGCVCGCTSNCAAAFCTIAVSTQHLPEIVGVGGLACIFLRHAAAATRDFKNFVLHSGALEGFLRAQRTACAVFCGTAEHQCVLALLLLCLLQHLRLLCWPSSSEGVP